MSYFDPPAHPWAPAKQSASNIPQTPSPSAVAFLTGPALGRLVHPQVPSRSWWRATSLMGEKGERARASLPPWNLWRRVLIHKTESSPKQTQSSTMLTVCSVQRCNISNTSSYLLTALASRQQKSVGCQTDAKASEMHLWWNCLVKR